MEFASFLKNLAYNIKSLSGFSKTSVKLTPDRTGIITLETLSKSDYMRIQL